MIARIAARSLTTDHHPRSGCVVDLRERRGVVYVSLEQQVPGFLLDEHGRAWSPFVSGSIAMNLALSSASLLALRVADPSTFAYPPCQPDAKAPSRLRFRSAGWHRR